MWVCGVSLVVVAGHFVAWDAGPAEIVCRAGCRLHYASIEGRDPLKVLAFADNVAVMVDVFAVLPRLRRVGEPNAISEFQLRVLASARYWRTERPRDSS